MTDRDERQDGAVDGSVPTAEHTRGDRLARRIDLWRRRIEGWVTGALLGGGMLLVVYTVAMRYLAPAHAPLFTNEITVYMVIWATLLAAGGVTHSRSHVRADLVLHMMSPRQRHILDIVANLAGFAFALFLVRFGAMVAYDAWDFGDLSPTSLRFPLWIYYALLPVAGVLIAIGHLRVAVELMLDGPEPLPPHRAEEG